MEANLTAATDAKVLSPLFVGDLGSIELLRMDFDRHPRARAVAEATTLRTALALLRQFEYSEVVIELAAKGYSAQTAANWIFRVDRLFPEVLFALFGNDAEVAKQIAALPTTQRNRLDHYLRIRREYTAADVNRLAEDFVRLRAAKPLAIHSTPRYRYDVVLSYAGEDRAFAAAIHDALRNREIEVFYDDAERSSTWGGTLPDRLQEIYETMARHCLIIVSSAYKSKPWTMHELRAAQMRANRCPLEDYILPVRLDSIDLPGLPKHAVYIDGALGCERIASEFERRIGDFLANKEFDA